MTIKQELNKEFIGEIIELYEIDLNPIGTNVIIRLTPHSENAVIWRSNTYSPFPIASTGAERSNTNAPGRVNLIASTNTTLLTSLMLQYGDLVGAHVTKWRTLSMYLDGRPAADPNQHWPVEKYIIIQRSSLNQENVTWVLANRLDQPGLVLPRRQTLRDVASRGSLWCPGQARFYSR